MICPECGSVVIVQRPRIDENGTRHYKHQCMRCFAEILITVTITTKGDPSLVTKYKEWLNEGRQEVKGSV